jgi:hypothetical protein
MDTLLIEGTVDKLTKTDGSAIITGVFILPTSWYLQSLLRKNLIFEWRSPSILLSKDYFFIQIKHVWKCPTQTKIIRQLLSGTAAKSVLKTQLLFTKHVQNLLGICVNVLNKITAFRNPEKQQIRIFWHSL